MAAAFRIGCSLKDMEFVQFHPTVLHGSETQRFLISEAVRGEGGILYNVKGQAFRDEYHLLRELDPRDIVARAIVDQMKKDGSGSVYLDITFKDSDFLRKRFPTIYAGMQQHGLDMAGDLLPVIPAAHYAIGGVRTDLSGGTNLPGLFVCGEAACAGVHGANRLASNSLLEGLVFAERVAGQIEKCGRVLNGSAHQKTHKTHKTQKARARQKEGTGGEAGKSAAYKPELCNELREELRRLMFSNAGILRDEKGLQEIRHFIKAQGETLEVLPESRAAWELKNLFLVSDLIVKSALQRTESRGCHFRNDYPRPDDDWQARHICIRRDQFAQIII
jgi:L-aspartate oxidase